MSGTTASRPAPCQVRRGSGGPRTGRGTRTTSRHPGATCADPPADPRPRPAAHRGPRPDRGRRHLRAGRPRRLGPLAVPARLRLPALPRRHPRPRARRLPGPAGHRPAVRRPALPRRHRGAADRAARPRRRRGGHRLPQPARRRRPDRARPRRAVGAAAAGPGRPRHGRGHRAAAAEGRRRGPRGGRRLGDLVAGPPRPAADPVVLAPAARRGRRTGRHGHPPGRRPADRRAALVGQHPAAGPAGPGDPGAADRRRVARVGRPDPVRGPAARAGPPLGAHPQAARPRRHRRDHGRRHLVAARGGGRGAQLGLPLHLGPRRRVQRLRAAPHRADDRGRLVPGLDVDQRRARRGSEDHVRPRRRPAAGGAGGPRPARLAGLGPRALGQRRGRADPARRVRRADGRRPPVDDGRRPRRPPPLDGAVRPRRAGHRPVAHPRPGHLGDPRGGPPLHLLGGDVPGGRRPGTADRRPLRARAPPRAVDRGRPRDARRRARAVVGRGPEDLHRAPRRGGSGERRRARRVAARAPAARRRPLRRPPHGRHGREGHRAPRRRGRPAVPLPAQRVRRRAARPGGRVPAVQLLAGGQPHRAGAAGRGRGPVRLAVRPRHPAGPAQRGDRPRDGSFLGNFPQAFSHLGVIASGWKLAQARRAEAGRP